MALPYESTPPPESTIQPAAPAATTASEPSGLDRALDDEPTRSDIDIDPLDRPLDEYKPAVPEHVQGLLGRMGQGKVYMIDETPGILHANQDARIRGDPRIAALAEQLDQHDPTEWLIAASAGSSSPLRSNALFIQSDLIKHLSTSKVFGWVTSLGAAVMGIEWLNDTTLHLIFPDATASLLALSLMSKAGFDPAEGDDPLIERSAHSIPIHLLPQAGLEPADKQEGKELLSAESTAGDGVIRRGRGAFRKSAAWGDDDESGVHAGTNEGGILDTIQLAPGVDATSRITVRFGLEGDKTARKGAKDSEWYKRHGRGAGKEVHTGPRRGVGTRESRYEDEFEGWTRGRGVEGEEARGGGVDERENGRQSGREFARRIGREKRGPYARPERNDRSGRADGDRGGRDGRDGRGKRSVDELDRELERFARLKAGLPVEDDDVDMVGEGGREAEMGGGGGERERGAGRGRRGGGGNKRETRGRDDLDKELDDMFAARAKE